MEDSSPSDGAAALPPPPPGGGVLETGARTGRCVAPAPEGTDRPDRYAGLLVLATLIGLGGIGYLIGTTAARTGDVWSTFGVWGFITGTRWVPTPAHGAPQFGALPMLYGTLLTSAIALVIAVPIAVGVALATTVFLPKRLRGQILRVIDLLAAVPSVVFGLFGVTVLVPAVQADPAVDRGPQRRHRVPRRAGDRPVLPDRGRGAGDHGAAHRGCPQPRGAPDGPDRPAGGRAGAGSDALGDGAHGRCCRGARKGIVGAVGARPGPGGGRDDRDRHAARQLAEHLGLDRRGPSTTAASKIALETGEATALQLSALTALALVLFAMAFLVNAAARLLVGQSATGTGRIRRTLRLPRPRLALPAVSAQLGRRGERAAGMTLGLAGPPTGMRRARSILGEGYVYVSVALAFLPLGVLLGYMIAKGAPAISWSFFTQLPSLDPLSFSGGIENALVGTLILMGLATAFWLRWASWWRSSSRRA